MLEDDSYGKQSVSGDPHIMDLVLVLEVLKGCEHYCAGCYVNTLNPKSDPNNIIEKAYKIAEYYVNNGLRFREIFVGSTDFFTAKNTDYILNHPVFQKMTWLTGKADKPERGNGFNEQNLGITATAVFDNIDMSSVSRLFSILDTEKYRDAMTVEFLIPLNVNKLINNDQKYYDDHMKAFEFFRNKTKKHVIYSFINNIHNNKMLKQDGIYELCGDIIKEKFDSILEHNPSFFRSMDRKTILSSINSWKNILESSINVNNLDKIHLTASDLHHGSLNTLSLHLVDNDIYFVPFVYENLLYNHPSLYASYEPQEISDKYSELISNAISYSTDYECNDCEYIIACAGRHVQNMMKILDTKKCIFPKQFRTLYEG